MRQCRYCLDVMSRRSRAFLLLAKRLPLRGWFGNDLMGAAVKRIALFLVASLMVASVIADAHAQSPAQVNSVWQPQALSYGDCMQRGADAMRKAGGTNVSQQNGVGMGFVNGTLGDYTATIMCITSKGLVILSIAGLDQAMANDYCRQLTTSMGGPADTAPAGSRR